MDDNKIAVPVHNRTLEVNTNEICRKVNDVRKYYIKPGNSKRQKKYRIFSHMQILAYNVYVCGSKRIRVYRRPCEQRKP